MKNTVKRGLSALLILLMLVSAFSGLSAEAKTGTVVTNTGVRHQTATSLSAQAVAYYTGSNTYERLSLLSGGNESCLDTVDSELFRALSDLMSSTMTNSISYKSLTSYWPKTDANNGSSDAVLFYSDEVSSSYNREHVWPKSRASFYESGGGSDIHHLRPTDTNVNSTRGNYTMGNVRNVISGYRTYKYNGKDVLYYAPSNDLVEVNDNIKGDVARILLYVYCRWEEPNLFENDPTPKVGVGDSGGNNGKKVIESLDTLLQWCEDDPVDTWEMCRNDQGENLQGNRNVFIDYPEFAWLLFGREIPSDMTTPSGESGNDTPAYTISAVSNNNAWGTVSLSGSTITAKPAEGYYAAGSEVLTGSATVTQNGNSFYVRPTSDCTVRINFAAKTPVTVSFSGATAAPISGYAGEAISLPTPTGVPANYTFVGWTEAPLAEATTQKPNYYAAGTDYTPTGNVTLYALFSYTEDGGTGSGDVFTLVTDAPSNWSGEYVLTSANAEKVLLADGTAPGTSAAVVDLSSSGMTLSGKTLSGVTDKYILVVEKVGSNYSFRLKGASENLYLAQTGSGNGDFEAVTSNTQTTAQWGISLSNGEAVIKNASYTNRTIRYNSGSTMFRTYTSGQQAVYLYAGSNVTTYYTSDAGVVPTPPTPCEHRNAAQVPETLPTCTEPGNHAYWHCPDCGKSFSDASLQTEIDSSRMVIPATGHSMQKTEAKEPTCTEPGNYAYWHCQKCGKYFKDQSGNAEYRDGEYLRAATGHSLTETPAKDPTENEAGNIRYWRCSVCGKYFRDGAGEDEISEKETVIPPLSHKHVLTETPEKPATCTEDGNIRYWHCAGCAKYFRDAEATDEVSENALTIRATGHELQKTEAKDPTCTEPGNIAYWQCSVCLKYFKDANGETETTLDQTVLKPTDHELNKTEAKEPTCTEPGNHEYWQCGVCQKYFQDPNGETETTLDRTVLPPTGHQLQKTEAKEPTCTEPGNIAYWYCGACQKYFKDANGETETTLDQTVLEPSKHQLQKTEAKEPTCTESGNIAYWQCSVCSKYFKDANGEKEIGLSDTALAPQGHSFGAWTETTAATCTTPGERTRTCARCGLEEHEAIATLPCSTDAYRDNPKGTWYHNAVDYMVRGGYMGGTAEGVFTPDGRLTRGELVTILYRIAGSPEVSGETKFTDVPSGRFFYDAVRWAEQNGVVNGITETTFEPGTPITREQIATVLYRYGKAEAVQADHLSAFHDGASVSSFAKDAMNWAVANGLFNGDHGNLNPRNNASRAEIAAILMRWLERD